MAGSKTTESTSVIVHKNLATAVIAVMKEVKGMEKNSRVGGNAQSAYDGTKDMDVKDVFNEKLAQHGLCILPIDIQETTQIDRWEEENTWNGKTTIKMKQNVFTKVNARYKLIHADSGESEILAGYGHGVDPQDKGAGKATTYALKNCLLYTFLTPVGKIDDAETTHSKDIATPPITPPITPSAPAKPKATKEEAIAKAVKAIEATKTGKELSEVWKKLGEKYQAVEAISKATAAHKAKLSKPKAA